MVDVEVYQNDIGQAQTFNPIIKDCVNERKCYVRYIDHTTLCRQMAVSIIEPNIHVQGSRAPYWHCVTCTADIDCPPNIQNSTFAVENLLLGSRPIFRMQNLPEHWTAQDVLWPYFRYINLGNGLKSQSDELTWLYLRYLDRYDTLPNQYRLWLSRGNLHLWFPCIIESTKCGRVSTNPLPGSHCPQRCMFLSEGGFVSAWVVYLTSKDILSGSTQYHCQYLRYTHLQC